MKRLLYISIVLLVLGTAACGGAEETPTEPDSASPAPTTAPPAGPAAVVAPEVTTPSEPAAATQPSESGGVFRKLWSDPPTLDPHLTSDTTSAGIVVEIFSGLVALSTDLALIPDIAASWTIDDGIVYTFTLRPDVKFHNGKSVTADDFKWSLERAANPKTASPVADTYLNDIVGAMDYIEGNASEISGITVIDDLTLRITIDAPKAYFLAKLTYPTAYVLDQETVELGGRNWWVDNPAGTGPFKLKEYRIGERIILERYDDYHREPAKVDRILMNLAGGQAMAMYENDELDVTGVGLFDLDRVLDPSEPLNKELVVAPPGFSVSYIGFNVTQAPFDDAKFRQALNHAVDKELIATEVLSELVVPAYGVLPPGFPGYNPDLQGLTYDPDAAVRLLGESGYAGYLANKEEGSLFYDEAQDLLSQAPAWAKEQTPRIVVTVPGTGGTISLDLEVIIEMWKQLLGVEVEIQQVEWATYLQDLDDKKFQAYAGLGWEANYPDPQDFLDVLFHTESNINHGTYSNPEVDSILEDARVEQDVVRRTALYIRAEELIINDGAWVPLWFTGDQYALIKPHVRGYELTPMIVPKLKQIRIE